jgi:hypothetical protein
MVQKKNAYNYTVDGFCIKKGFASDDHATRSNKQLFIVSSLATKLSTKGFLSNWISRRNEETFVVENEFLIAVNSMKLCTFMVRGKNFVDVGIFN